MSETTTHKPDFMTDSERYLKAYRALIDFEEADKELQQFKQDFEKVFSALAYIQQRLLCAEENLKVSARGYGKALEGDNYNVTVTPKTKRWFDTDYILQACPFVKDIPGVIVQTVDKAKIELLAKGGMIPEEVVKEAQRVEALTSAVTIKRKEAQT